MGRHIDSDRRVQVNRCAGRRSLGLVVFDEGAEAHIKYARQLRKSQHADVELATFKARNERPIQVGCQGELFLTHFSCAPSFSQAYPDPAQQRV